VIQESWPLQSVIQITCSILWNYSYLEQWHQTTGAQLLFKCMLMSLQVSNNYFNIDELKMKSTIFDNSSTMMHISLWFLSSSRRRRWKDETAVKEDRRERIFFGDKKKRKRQRWRWLIKEEGGNISNKLGFIAVFREEKRGKY